MKSSSLAWRAFIAVALLIGFYVFALAIICLLLWLPFVLWRPQESLVWNLQVAISLGVPAAIIAFAIIPRPDRFVAPGPELTARDQPALFAVLTEVANAVDQAMPVQVFLIMNLNAGVDQRGGVMGFGSRRVMGLGLPLLQVLSVSELRAVLAHEFGHYYGGDTRLGPWVYTTSTAIGRTLVSMEGFSKALSKVFVPYGRLFLRVTQAISRQQEYSADALAARTFGAEALVKGLRAIHGNAPAFAEYLNQEFVPVLNGGYRPSLVEGFACFIQVPDIKSKIAAVLEEEIKTIKTKPYDSHPFGERLARLETYAAGKPFVGETPAISLLQNVPELEKRLVATFMKKDLPVIEWDDVGNAVYLPEYRNLLLQHGAVLRGISPAMLPEYAASTHFMNYLKTLGATSEDIETSIKQGDEFGIRIVGSALVNLLIQRGWSMDVSLGMPVTLRLADNSIQPFKMITGLFDKSLAADAWREQCQALGIADVDLGLVPVLVEQEKKEG